MNIRNEDLREIEYVIEVLEADDIPEDKALKVGARHLKNVVSSIKAYSDTDLEKKNKELKDEIKLLRETIKYK